MMEEPKLPTPTVAGELARRLKLTRGTDNLIARLSDQLEMSYTELLHAIVEVWADEYRQSVDEWPLVDENYDPVEEGPG